MAVTHKRLKTGVQLGTGETTITSGAANTVTRIDKLVFTNTSSSAVTVTVYYYGSGDAAADDTTLVKDKNIGAGKSWICVEAENQRLDGSAVLSALASAATAVTVSCSGLEIVN